VLGADQLQRMAGSTALTALLACAVLPLLARATASPKASPKASPTAEPRNIVHLQRLSPESFTSSFTSSPSLSFDDASHFRPILGPRSHSSHPYALFLNPAESYGGGGFSLTDAFQHNGPHNGLAEGHSSTKVQKLHAIGQSAHSAESHVSFAECPTYDGCAPLASCAACFDELPSHPCDLGGDQPGACCPPRRYAKGPSSRLFPTPRKVAPTPRFNMYQLNEAARFGLWDIEQRDLLEQDLQRRGTTVTNKRSPEYRHLQFFRTSQTALRIARAANVVERSTYFLMDRYDLTPDQAGYGLQDFSVRDTILRDSCLAAPTCSERDQYYRTIDGSCNNAANPAQGMARTDLRRILPPYYEDGVYAPRGGPRDRRLPSARVVSVATVADADDPSAELSLSVMQWGQFIDHDITHVPITRFDNETGVECCTPEGAHIDPNLRHPACLPISLPEDDPFFARVGRRCMNFVRSLISQNEGCSFGFAEQMNQITHYLDGSAIYGSSDEEARGLRAGHGGLLQVQGRALLPADPEAEECDAADRGRDCFMAGDSRVNEQPSLAVIHTVWMREHNRLALRLAKLNPHWSDETIYQEARRIVAAQMQHIVYNEWLPIVLGKRCMEDNDLLPRRSGYASDYDPGLDATISNEFATAAFRFGHTLVQGMVQLYGKRHKRTETLELHEHFNSPHLLYTPGKLDEFLRGLIKQPIQKYDNFVSAELTNRLFQGTNNDFGMDLVALNIQRGRDHGIPPYAALREACGLPRPSSFDDLRDVMRPEAIERFRRIYASVDDIDAFPAGIAETPTGDALLGPTFKCIVAEQFIRLRRGDRFFYENGNLNSSFTPAQLAEIRKSSWARILCDNADHMKEVPPLAMRTASKANPKVSCRSHAVPSLDLAPWVSLGH